jgi:uncharacterized glyoxalase superfamily protein PhnB
MTEPQVIPMLAYEDAGRAADWICHAFGFHEIQRYADETGTVTDVVLERDDGATVLVGHPNDAYEGPRKHAEHCAAAARWLDRPVAAGARIISELETNPLQRQYRVEDVEGHRWMFATEIKG